HYHPHLQLFRHDLGSDARRAAERHPYLPDQDLRSRLRPVPVGGCSGLRRFLDPRARALDRALFPHPELLAPEGACSMRKRPRSRRIGLTILQIALAIIVLLPFFWMVSVSLKPATEPVAIPARLWPENPTLEHYISAFRPEFRTYFLNSLIVSLST